MVRRLLFLSILILLGCEPMGPISGGELDGVVQPVPDNWASTTDLKTDLKIVQLETRLQNPYSINIWGVFEGNKYYIASGNGDEVRWVGYILANPDVRLRIGKIIYEMTATRVTDESELDNVRELYEEKYDMDSVNREEADEVWLFRLTSRDQG